MLNRYSTARYFFLTLLILWGVIYSLPNLFGEDPALEVASTDQYPITVSVLNEKVQEIFIHEGLQPLNTEERTHSVLFRFQDPHTQLQAKDILKKQLGRKVTVGFTLASRTPSWLTALGAAPLHLGLDLRGGVHFLLAVDVDSVIETRLKSAEEEIRTALREAHIRYVRLERQGKLLQIYFKTKEELTAGSQVFTKKLLDYQESSRIENATEPRLTVQFRPVMLAQLIDYALEQTVTILNNRVNELGVSEAVIQRQGLDKVSVDLPGIQDIARAKELIGKTATLRFQLVDEEHDPEKAVQTFLPIGSELNSYNSHPILLINQVILQGNAITYAAARMNELGEPEVAIRLGGNNAALFHEATAKNIGHLLAVVYTEPTTEQRETNGKILTVRSQEERVISVATIRSALGNQFSITGLPTLDYARNLALLLRSGALIAPVTFVQEQLIGPSLGQANIQRGMLSLIIGSLLVFIFMVLYYRWFGFIADLALLLNMILIVACLSLLGATLTLAGIAGIVLTVGMAVDANVLIYERIREELGRGASPQASIHAGYEKAFATIIDANMTTLIVALVLFALGSAQVKGFAISLSIGLLASMLTAIFFTRAVVNAWFGQKSLKTLPIGLIVKRES